MPYIPKDDRESQRILSPFEFSQTTSMDVDVRNTTNWEDCINDKSPQFQKGLKLTQFTTNRATCFLVSGILWEPANELLMCAKFQLSRLTPYLQEN